MTWKPTAHAGARSSQGDDIYDGARDFVSYHLFQPASELHPLSRPILIKTPSAFSFFSIAIWGRARASSRANISPQSCCLYAILLPMYVLPSFLTSVQLSLHAYTRAIFRPAWHRQPLARPAMPIRRHGTGSSYLFTR